MMLTEEKKSKALTKIMSDDALKRMYTKANARLRKFMLIAAITPRAGLEEIERYVTDRLNNL